MAWLSTNDYVTKHVEKNFMSGLQTERACRWEKGTTKTLKAYWDKRF